MNINFRNDVDQGLSASPKTLPSKYFYDKTGSALFAKIMKLPEYYLTDCELDIFKNKTHELIQAFGIAKDTYFELIELGAGDGTKTKELLKVLDAEGFHFDYFTVDISMNALQGLKENFEKELPNVTVHTQQGDYFEVLASLKENEKPKVVLFLGSNIGNMPDEVSAEFIAHLGENLKQGDKLLVGADLIKSKDIVLPAYNDSQGITAQFNINLLHRINQELNADFNLKQFKHQPEYDEKEGIAKSYIESLADQTVTIGTLNKKFEFEKGERIHTEISRKYIDEIFKNILKNSAFEIRDKITDSKGYFADYILDRK